MEEEVFDQSAEEVDTTEPQETQDVQSDEVPADQPEAEQADDSEEIEYEGANYKVPKVLKDAFLRHADYTRKTQELADGRKAFEQQQSSFKENAERQMQHIQDYAQIHALDMQLKNFEGVDWQKLIDSDPVEAMKLDRQYRSLHDMRNGLATRIREVEAREAFEKQQNIAKLIEKGRETLKREIPNWSDATQTQIRDYAISTGFSAEEVAQVVDPRHVKVLHKAYLYDQMVKKAATTPKAEVKPVSRVSTREMAQKDPDKMTTEEWVKWRNQQIKRRA